MTLAPRLLPIHPTTFWIACLQLTQQTHCESVVSVKWVVREGKSYVIRLPFFVLVNRDSLVVVLQEYWFDYGNSRVARQSVWKIKGLKQVGKTYRSWNSGVQFSHVPQKNRSCDHCHYRQRSREIIDLVSPIHPSVCLRFKGYPYQYF